MPVYTNMQGDQQLAEIQARDTSGLLGPAGTEVISQDLIDAIADRVATKLLAKSQVVNNLLATVAGNVLDATQGKALKDQINNTNSHLNFMRNHTLSLSGLDTNTELNAQLFSKWIDFPSSSGMVAFSNNTNTYCGIYNKYDNYNGTILFISATGKLRIWSLEKGVNSITDK